MAVAYSARNVTVPAGGTTAVFEIQRTGTSEILRQTTAVEYRTEDGTAISGTNYTGTSGSLSFSAGVTSQQLGIDIVPDQAQSTGDLIFLLELKGFGAATARISPVQADHVQQSYWLVPGDGEPQPVPGSGNAGAYAKTQMDVKSFDDPTSAEAYMPVPQSYMRIGYARPDMSYAERVIAESEDFFAREYKHGTPEADSDSSPKEPGSTHYFAKPRNINRKEKGWQDEKDGNIHLDGIFLYTSGNLTSSVRGSASYVIGKDYVRHIGGETRLNYMGEVASTYLSKESGTMRIVEGVTSIGPLYLDYEVKRTQTLEVAAELAVKYALAAEFSASMAAQIELLNGIKFEISNAGKLEVAGLEIAGKISADGSYEAEFPGGELASTKSEIQQAATEEIVLQIDPPGGKARKAAVMAYAAMTAASSATAAAGTAVPFVLSDDQFEKLANPNEMNAAFSSVMDLGLPGTFALLGGAGIAALGLLRAMQQIAAVAPAATPKIKMTPTQLELSVGPSSLKMTATDIVISSPAVEVVRSEEFYVGAGKFNVKAVDSTIDAVDNLIRGKLTVAGKTSVMDSLWVSGEVDATSVVAGV